MMNLENKIIFYNDDCLKALKCYNDKHFNIAQMVIQGTSPRLTQNPCCAYVAVDLV